MSSLEYKKAYNKEVREWRKSRGLCTYCGREKAEGGYTTCLACRLMRRERRQENQKPLTDEERARKNEKRRIKSAEKKEAGICYQCSKPVYKNHAYCYEHYLSQRRADERSRRKKYPYYPNGTCRICGKEPAPGHKMCPDHYKVFSERMSKYNEERSRMNEELRQKREAAKDILKVLVPALGIGDIAVTDNKMIVRIDDQMYVVSDGGRMGVKALAEVVRDLVLYGHSKRVSYVKEVTKR